MMESIEIKVYLVVVYVFEGEDEMKEEIGLG